jgi:uncharacterized RDD family membrane protein YckC
VGAISYGLDLLDTQVAGTAPASGEEGAQNQLIAIMPVEGESQPTETIIRPGSVSISASQVSLPSPTPQPRIRSQANLDAQNTLVGLLIASAQGVDGVTHRLDRMSRLAGRMIDPLVSPVVGSRAFRPIRQSWEGMVLRGQREVDTWKQLGEEETARGQELLQNVTMSTVNASIDYITVQPEVTDLVTHQTTTITSELLTVFRGLLFNLDFILEGLLRRLFHMTPRREIPGPSREIRERGVTGFIQFQEKPDIDAPGSWAGYYSGIASRTTSLAIDLTLLAVVMAFVAFFAQQVMDFMRVGLSLLPINLPLDQLGTGEDPLSKFLVSSMLYYSVFVLYHTIAWCITGATIGDAVAGLRVVTLQAELPTPLRAFLRVTIGYSLSFLLFGFGFLMVLWTSRRRGLHDNLFKTVKVYSWNAHPSDRLLRRLAKQTIPEENSNPKTDE